MIQYLIVVAFAFLLGVVVFDVLTKKRTEINGAHVVVSWLFFVVFPPHFSKFKQLQFARKPAVKCSSAEGEFHLCFRSLEGLVVLERLWQSNLLSVELT